MINKTKLLAGVTALAIGLTSNVFAQGMEDVKIKAEDLGGGIYVLFGAGGNIGASIGEDGIFLIDDQYAPLTPRILAALKELSDEKVKFVLNTHYHGDHTGGNENLGTVGAVIVAHDNIHARLLMAQIKKIEKDGGEINRTGLPQITFNNQVSFHFNGNEARAYHIANAHTDGDSIIYFKDNNIIHMGDLMFNYRFPYIDVDAGGNVSGVINGVEMALSMANGETKIIPGHGPMASKEDLQKYHDMLTFSKKQVQALINDGKSLEEVLAEKVMADYAEKWNWAFIKEDRYVTSVYRSLAD